VESDHTDDDDQTARKPGRKTFAEIDKRRMQTEKLLKSFKNLFRFRVKHDKKVSADKNEEEKRDLGITFPIVPDRIFGIPDRTMKRKFSYKALYGYYSMA
jgi:hypothetical protein